MLQKILRPFRTQIEALNECGQWWCGRRRKYRPGEEGERVLEIPPLGMTALTWGFFMGVSSNLRYQAVFGLERVVDRTIAKRFPPVPFSLYGKNCVVKGCVSPVPIRPPWIL